jgi:hypothetical protein
MAKWHESREQSQPQRSRRFGGKGRGTSPKGEAAAPPAPETGLCADRRRLVEAYYGVYPADAAARNRANVALRYKPAQLEAAG